jgi:hypothetical protein
MQKMRLKYFGRTCINQKIKLLQHYRLLCMYRLHTLCKRMNEENENWHIMVAK